MKILFRIFGILAILMALTMGGLAISRCQEDKESLNAETTEAKAKITELKQQSAGFTGETKTTLDEEISKAETELSKAPSSSSFLIMQVFISVLLILAVAFGAFLFKPNSKTIHGVAGALIITILLYFIAPDIKRGEYGGMEDKTMALMVGVPTLIAGLFAFLIAPKNIAAKSENK